MPILHAAGVKIPTNSLNGPCISAEEDFADALVALLNVWFFSIFSTEIWTVPFLAQLVGIDGPI